MDQILAWLKIQNNCFELYVKGRVWGGSKGKSFDLLERFRPGQKAQRRGVPGVGQIESTEGAIYTRSPKARRAM